MMTAEIILEVRKKSPFLLLATVVTFGIFYYTFSRHLILFRSESNFYVNEDVVLNAGLPIEPQELTILTTMATNKVLLLISSDEMRDSIANDFDLYSHYGVNRDDQFAHEKVLLRLNKMVSVRRDPTSVGQLHLIVDDADRYVAAGMANKILDRVNRMDKAILQKDLKKRAGEYESLLPSLQEKATGSRKEFFSFVDSVSPIGKQSNDMPVRYKMIASDLGGKMDKNTNRYDEMLERYYLIMGNVKTVGNDEWQCITVVKKALPDITSWQVRVVLYSLAASLFALLFYISILIYFYEDEDKMRLLMLIIKGNQEKK